MINPPTLRVPSAQYIRTLVSDLLGVATPDVTLDLQAPLSALGLAPLEVIELVASISTAMHLHALPLMPHPNLTVFDVVSACITAEMNLSLSAPSIPS